jgi:hypothetical protein
MVKINQQNINPFQLKVNTKGHQLIGCRSKLNRAIKLVLVRFGANDLIRN